MVRFVLSALAALAASSAAASDAAETLRKMKKKGSSGTGPKSKSKSKDQCPVNGWELFRHIDPEAVDMRVETTVDKETCMYEVTMSFLPDLDLPYMKDTIPVGEPVSNANQNEFLPPFRDDQARRDEWNMLCEADGRFEVDASLANPNGMKVPNWPENHAGLSDIRTEYTYTLELPKKVKKITGVDNIAIGSSPCGLRLQPYPQYNIHFYLKKIKERKKMTCITEGGFFCLDSEFQTCGDGLKFNTDGSLLMRCEDGSFANVPEGHTFTVEKTVLPPAAFREKTNSAVATQGLHGLNPQSLFDINFRSFDEPNLLLLNWDREIVGIQIHHWSGFSMGHSSTADWAWPASPIQYNCQDMEKYGRLPTTVAAKYDEESGRSTYTIRGPAGKCKSFSDVTTAKGKSGKSKGKKKEH